MRDVARARPRARRTLGALAGGNAGGGLVEQQDARARRQRQRDLDQALLAVGRLRVSVSASPSRRSDCAAARVASSISSSRRATVRDQRARPALALADREHDRLEHRQAGEQRVDLERARQAALDALVLRQGGDALVAEEHLARGRRKHAGQQVDQRGLARAVGRSARGARRRRTRASMSLFALKAPNASTGPAVRSTCGHRRSPPRTRAQRGQRRPGCRRGRTARRRTSSRPSQNCQ